MSETIVSVADGSAGIPLVPLEAEPIAEGPSTSKKGIGVLAWLSIGWLVGLLVLSIAAPLLPIPDPKEVFPEMARKGPTLAHPFGGDAIGRDVLSRVIYGTRSSYIVGFGSIAFGMLIGGLLGLMTGFFRGKVDSFLTPLMNVLLAIPQFVLALSLVTVLATGGDVTSGRRLVVVVLGLGIVSIPLLGRITRANTLAWSEREFVLASKAMGARSWRIMLRDVLPNVIPAMLAIAFLGVGIAIVAEGGLSLFGVGVQLPTPSWGNIISEGQSQMRLAPHIVMFASLVLFVTVMALNYLGDVVSRKFDVKESAL
ncbi:MAG: ABC transporter permease [Microthrixaceae bacterium]